MSRINSLVAFILTAAAALLASTPLMLLLERSSSLSPVAVIVTGIVIAVVLVLAVGLLCAFTIKRHQPMAAWTAAGVSGLVTAAVAALAL